MFSYSWYHKDEPVRGHIPFFFLPFWEKWAVCSKLKDCKSWLDLSSMNWPSLWSSSSKQKKLLSFSDFRNYLSTSSFSSLRFIALREKWSNFTARLHFISWWFWGIGLFPGVSKVSIAKDEILLCYSGRIKHVSLWRKPDLKRSASNLKDLLKLELFWHDFPEPLRATSFRSWPEE